MKFWRKVVCIEVKRKRAFYSLFSNPSLQNPQDRNEKEGGKLWVISPCWVACGYALSGKAKLRESETSKQSQTGLLLHRVPEIWRADFFFPLVFIWVFGPEFSRLYLSFPTLSRKKKKSLCLSLECNDEEQRDRHKTKERKASSLCSILVLALGSSTSYLKKKFKSVLNKSTKNNQSVFQNPPFMKNSLCFTREKTLFFFLNSSLWILSLSQRVVETGKMFCFTLSFPPALLYIVLWKTGS